MNTAIQPHSLNIPVKNKNITTKNRENTLIPKYNITAADTVSFKAVKVEIGQCEKVIKSVSNSFLTEVATAWSTLIGLFKLKDKTLNFEKMSRKEIKTFLAKRQFRLCFESSYEKYNISGKQVNLVTKCKKYPEFAKEIFNMKEKDIFHRSRFSEQDIAELFLSHEMNPKLTKELLYATNSDGSNAFGARIIRALVESKNDKFVQECLETLTSPKY